MKNPIAPQDHSDVFQGHMVTWETITVQDTVYFTILTINNRDPFESVKSRQEHTEIAADIYGLYFPANFVIAIPGFDVTSKAQRKLHFRNRVHEMLNKTA